MSEQALADMEILNLVFADALINFMLVHALMHNIEHSPKSAIA